MALSCSKETAMPTRRFERAQLLIVGCAVMFGSCVLIEHAQAQPGYVPPPTPLPPPVFNPSNPYTVPQPSYRPITPSTPTPSIVPSDEVTSPTVRRGEVTSPAYEEAPRRTARSHHRRRAPVGSAYSYWTTARRVFLCRLRVSVRLATVVGRILVSNVALFLVRREGLRLAKLPELL